MLQNARETSGLMPPTPLIYGCLTAISRLLARAHILLLSVLLGGLLFSAAPTAAATSDDRNDRDALVALYNATDGDNWTNNTNWLGDKALHEWHGVATDEDGRVLELHLHESQLSGEIPSELGSLSNLTVLGLGGNQLSGSIPSELGSLSNLTVLQLSGNQLSGEIPPELSSLSNLARLQLDYNKLTGPIPPELGSLSNLTVFGLGGNQLSGSIPSELGNLSNLTWLGLELNRLRGEIPSELGNLSNLTSLYLQGAGQLSGTIPSELGNLSNLRDLRLAGNRHLVACLPEEARVLRATLPPKGTDIHLLADCTGMEVALTTNEDPLTYNDNVFVLPVTEDLVAGQLQLRDYAERFYEYFHDDFDFLIFVSNLSLFNHNPFEPTWWELEYEGVYHGVMNDVQGIGEGMYSLNREWGSEDALKGTIHVSYSGAFSIGPALHELMHRWGNYIVLTGFGPHWGFSSANGQLGGFDISDLVDHGGGRYSVGSTDPAPYGWRAHIKPYSPIELYLAGLIPPEEVPDLWVAEDVEVLNEYTDYGDPIFTASKVRTYAIEDIIAEHGKRIPDSSQSQKDFRAAAILLIDEDHPAIKWQLDKVSGTVSSFSLTGADEFDDTYNFYEATGGRATITMDGLSQSLKKSGAASVPGAPAGLTVTANALSGIELSWSEPASAGGLAVTAYDVRHIETSADETADSNWTVLEGVWTIGVGALQYTLSGLTPGTQYDLQVRAANGLGAGPWSATATGTQPRDCTTGIAVPNPANNPGMVSDCKHLLGMKDAFRGSAPLNWSADTAITKWDGVRLGGSPERVTKVKLQRRGLDGHIPAAIGRLEMLEELWLYNNELSGVVPPELGSLSNLRWLFVSNNDLSGQIPGTLNNLSLDRLWLHRNSFTGCVPYNLTLTREYKADRELPACEPPEEATPPVTFPPHPDWLVPIAQDYPYMYEAEYARVYSDISPEFSRDHAIHLNKVFKFFAQYYAQSRGHAVEAYYTAEPEVFKEIVPHCPTIFIPGARNLTACYGDIARWFIIPYQIPDYGTQLHEISHDFLYATFPRSEEFPWYKEGTGMYFEGGEFHSSGELVVSQPHDYCTTLYDRAVKANNLIRLNPIAEHSETGILGR